MTNLKRGPIPGLPDSTLQDCLFVTGKRGGGKSFSQRIAMERALTKGLRTGWVDSLGIGWGITVAGTPGDLEKPIGPGYDVVVFGGLHGHMPLAPTAGAALGTLLAKATFSWVVDLSQFKSKAQRVTFMAAFIDAIYENTTSQLLLLMDEVDLWAPQNLFDKQGPAAALLGSMDEIVRRGRIKGISVWMATQRPAVVNKNIISQADGMLAFKTTAPQDTEAVMSWMKAHLKKDEYLAQLAQLSALHKGEAFVYLTEPEISIRRQQFPLIDTLDTFKPQKAGKTQSDKLAAKPDIAALQQQLGSLEEKLKADDPAHLKAEVARLKAELAKKLAPSAAPVANVGRESEARADGYRTGFQEGYQSGWVIGHDAGWRGSFDAAVHRVSAATGQIPPKVKAPTAFEIPEMSPTRKARAMALIKTTGTREKQITPGPMQYSRTDDPPPLLPLKKTLTTTAALAASIEGINNSQRKVLNALAWWYALGNAAPEIAMIAVVCGWRTSSGGTNNRISELVTAGYVERKNTGTASLTDAGHALVEIPIVGSQADLRAMIKGVLTGSQIKVLDALIAQYPDTMTVPEIAVAAGWEETSGGTNNRISELVTMSMVTRPQKGVARAADWLFI